MDRLLCDVSRNIYFPAKTISTAKYSSHTRKVEQWPRYKLFLLQQKKDLY